MITVKEATEIINDNPLELKTEKINLENAPGRVLAEDVFADRDFPPFNRVMMDGVAISSSGFSPDKYFPIQNIQAAGTVPIPLENQNHCIEIMTGAVLPDNTDAVIPYEEMEKKESKIKILLSEVKRGQNIHLKGTDRKKGDLILRKGKMTSPAEIGVLATVGKSEIEVYVNPKAAIFSTGDELVEVDENPKPFQIRKSNAHVVAAVLEKENIESERIHVNDKKEIIKSALEKALDKNDFVILSGGVSKGRYDYVPEILEEIGVEKLFHRVRQRPGKPFWFGRNENGKIIFALPGNPVSTFMCVHRYVLPWLRLSIGGGEKIFPSAELAEDFIFEKKLQYFLQVKIRFSNEGKLMAFPMIGKGSGDLANLVEADGFLELPEKINRFEKGMTFPFISFRNIL